MCPLGEVPTLCSYHLMLVLHPPMQGMALGESLSKGAGDSNVDAESRYSGGGRSGMSSAVASSLGHGYDSEEGAWALRLLLVYTELLAGGWPKRVHPGGRS